MGSHPINNDRLPSLRVPDQVLPIKHEGLLDVYQCDRDGMTRDVSASPEVFSSCPYPRRVLSSTTSLIINITASIPILGSLPLPGSSRNLRWRSQ
jgi:hypothetical protein